jgi:predicted phosphodiesterase
MWGGPFAVFSDIHSNLEALEAVLEDMDSRGALPHVCLGDLVGYGPNPKECLQRVRGLGCEILKGNHDEAILKPARVRHMNEVARHGLEFSISKLSQEQSEYLGQLPLVFTEERATYVHSSLDQPARWNYVNEEIDVRSHFENQRTRVTFCGHTHTPMVYCLEDPEADIEVLEGEGRIHLPSDRKILINVGSVGQPRDMCPDACYVVCDPKIRWVEFRRVPYDISKTRRKVARANLHEFIGLRLLLGI